MIEVKNPHIRTMIALSGKSWDKFVQDWKDYPVREMSWTEIFFWSESGAEMVHWYIADSQLIRTHTESWA